MKKILFSAAALLTMLSAASCQKENLSGAEGELTTVTLSVKAPAVPSTKGYGDGTTAKYLVFGVFDEEGNELTDLRQGDWVNTTDFPAQTKTELTFDQPDAEGRPMTTVTVNLAKGKTYTFICWAQAKEYDSKALTCYDFSDLKAIEVDYTVDNAANNEHRDAFYACVSSGLVREGHTQTIVLTRPFAQLNVGTDDLDAAANAGIDLSKLYVDVEVTMCPTVLNADMANQAYTVSGETTAKFTKALCPAAVAGAETLDVTIDNKDLSYGWLSFNYIFTSLTKDDVKTVSFNLYEDDVQLVSYTKDNTPFQANWRTNLLGRLYTLDSEITVVIDPIFEDDNNVTDGIKDVTVNQTPVVPAPTPAPNIYLVPNANWNIDGARFAVYSWGVVPDLWVDMKKVAGEDNIYYVDTNDLKGNTSIIFCRMNPNNSTNDWDSGIMWNQTNDLTVPVDLTVENCYTVADGAWSKGDGSWSLKK